MRNPTPARRELKREGGETMKNDGKRSKLLIVKQVADLLQISTRQVLRLPIPRVMIGARTVRFHEEDVHAYIQGSRSSH